MALVDAQVRFTRARAIGDDRRRAILSTSPSKSPPKSRLVGREAELSGLDEELRRACDGQFRCVLMSADPGMGKTRLAAELLAQNRRKVIALSARAYPLGRTTSFGLWAEALDRYLRDLPPERILSLCGGFLDDLAGLLRSVATIHGSIPTHDIPRFRLFEGLAVLVKNLAAELPVIVALDDLHHADDSSWEVLNYLAHNISGARVLVVVGVRPAELAEQPAGKEVVLALEQEGMLGRLALGPLEPEAVAELAAVVLDREPPRALVAWLVERSRGNPLFVLSLLRALVEEASDLSAPTLRSLPEGLADRVTGSLRLLDEPAIATLEMLAVLGRPVELAALERLSDRPLERLGEILHGLVRARLVVEVEHGRELTYEIVHPLAQEAIYQGIGGARRRALHRLAGQALLASERVGEAAPHFARSADPGDQEAIGVLLEAVRQAERREAYGEVLTIIGALVELLPASDPRWLEVLQAMSQAEWVVDDRADSYSAQGLKVMRSLDALFEASPSAAVRAAVKLRMATFLGYDRGEEGALEGEGILRQAQSLFEQAGDRRGALLAAFGLAWICGIRRDWKGLADGARQVAEAAIAEGQPLVEMQARLGMGLGCHASGAFAEGEEALRRAVALAREGQDAYVVSRNLGNLALLLAAEGCIHESFVLLQEAKSLYPDRRERLLLPKFESLISWLAGDFPGAAQGASETLGANRAGVGKVRAMAVAVAALAAAETDRLSEARKYAAVARLAYGDGDWFGLAAFSAWADVLIAWREGRHSDALRDLRAGASALLRESPSPWLAWGLVDLAEMAAEGGDADAAAHARLHLHEIAESVDRDLYRAFSALGSAWAELAFGSHVEAGRQAGQAAEWFARLGYRAFEGRALDVLGRSLAATDRPGALHALDRAVEVFRACGATWRAQRSLRELRQLGSTGRRAAAAALGPSSLSKREWEVARLAAKGLTASEIAERLFIGKRTVETHLTSVYAKLGVESKLDLVHRASELIR